MGAGAPPLEVGGEGSEVGGEGSELWVRLRVSAQASANRVPLRLAADDGICLLLDGVLGSLRCLTRGDALGHRRVQVLQQSVPTVSADSQC